MISPMAISSYCLAPMSSANACNTADLAGRARDRTLLSVCPGAGADFPSGLDKLRMGLIMAHDAAGVERKSRRLASMAAGLLILTTLVELLAIWHHPHVRTYDQLQSTLEMVAVTNLAEWIHGLAIGCSLLIAYCLGELLRNRVPAALLRAAALVYAAGISAWIAAATVDGWVLERLAAGLPHVTPLDLDANVRLFRLCMAW